MGILMDDPGFRGSFMGIMVFERFGKLIVQTVSSLDGKRWLEDPAFTGSRASANRLGISSQLASLVYNSLQQFQKARNSFKSMTGKAFKMIKKGIEFPDVVRGLIKNLK
jgi:hypothetical protein